MAEKNEARFEEKSTSGLTSGSQLFNVTSAISYETSNTSSAIIAYPIPSPQKESEVEEIKPFTSKRFEFKKALKKSIRKNIDVLNELAKY
ncbi:MAG: hypothetical protein ACTSSA_05740 [Candidatus Freyarchaeota archaeon]|nr:hypothetical protein [Candidatus Freyarchaeota archaeon]